MAQTFHDTLRDRLLPFEPAEPGKARIYVCGPTVYDYAHLGHVRCYVVYDVLVRHLRASGMEVKYVRNVTDVDDKIIKRAAELGESPLALAARFTESYREDLQRVFCLPPDVEPKVSEHVPDILALIQRLIDQGSAYASEGDVYFSVATFPEYGKLSHRKLADMEFGASGRLGDGEEQKKRHPADFALWKAAKPGEPSWQSPWGAGRPGWHIECSAMCMRHLGDAFDLHGGGLDLVFPHHENEIAQSEAVTGKPLAKLWVHNGFIEVNKEKMSKSLGNFFTARECFRLVEPEALRYFVLTTHYRAPLSLDWSVGAQGEVTGFPQIEECERRVEYLYTTAARITALAADKLAQDGTVEAELRDIPGKLSAALDEDLNMPAALAVVSELLKRANDFADLAARKPGKLNVPTLRAIEVGLRALSAQLGLGLDDGPAFLRRVRSRRARARGMQESDVEAKIVQRIEARKNREFARADELRAELSALGVELMDSPEGTTWRLP
ncbi:MAG TPA: cysteine--tRNA ligase [Polyangiales bacterium]